MARSSIAVPRQLVRDFGTCLNFTTTSQYVTLGSYPAGLKLTNLTYTAWVKCPTTSGSKAIIGGSDVGGGGPEFRVDPANTISFLKQNVAGIGTSTGKVNSAQWNFVAVTYNSSGAYAFYINGEAAGSGTNLQTFAYGSNNFIFGNALNGSPERFVGSLDDVRVYGSVLTPTEITNLFNGLNPSATPVGHWKLDEGSGTTATDSGSGGNNGTLTGSPTYSTDVFIKPRTVAGSRQLVRDFGTCLNFSGSGQYITVSDSASLRFGASTNFSIWGWFKPRSITGTQTLMRKGNGANVWLLRLNGDKLETIIGDTADVITVTGTTVLKRGLWYFVCATFNRTGNASLYLNSVSDATPASITAVGSGMDTAFALGIAQNPNAGGTELFNGFMDEIGVANSALTQTEIDNLFYNGTHPSSTVSRWKLDEGSGTSATDSVGANTGTITGATYSSDVFIKPRTAV